MLLPTGRLGVELWLLPSVSGSWDLVLDRNSSPSNDHFPRQAYTYSGSQSSSPIASLHSQPSKDRQQLIPKGLAVFSPEKC